MTVMIHLQVSCNIRLFKSELKKLSTVDYPGYGKCNAEDRRITVISTSLIEAGSRLDFYTVFRENGKV